jgi:hypothetical protein
VGNPSGPRRVYLRRVNPALMQLRIININILIDNHFQYKISIGLFFSEVTAEGDTPQD